MSAPTSPPTSPPVQAVAPVWHTIMVLTILLGISAVGARHEGFGLVRPGHNKVLLYLATTSIEWLMVGLVCLGLRSRNHNLRTVLGPRWGGPRRLFRDVGWAVLFLIAADVFLGVLSHWLKATPTAGIRHIIPHGTAELAVYPLVALSAGICEEIVFRGYLQRQFAAWLNGNAAPLVLQGVVFGAAHGYQGPKRMLVLGVCGVLFGLLAQWQRSLRPGMISHFLQDFIAGLVAARFMK